MMKTKTNTLTRAALDLAVAKAWQSVSPAAHLLTTHAKGGFHPSTDWAQGGPIIEREGIRIEPEKYSATGFASWRADIPKGPTSLHGYRWAFGPTPLIAAMRCYVASKLGDEVDVPEELK